MQNLIEMLYALGFILLVVLLILIVKNPRNNN